MGTKRAKKNKHKKKKWLSLQNILHGKPHTPYYSSFLLDTYYCSTCEYFIVNKKEEKWTTCPNCHSSQTFCSIGKKDMSSLL